MIDKNKRDKISNRAIKVSLIGNVVLTILNFVVGLSSNSSALISFAADQFSDILMTIAMAIGLKIGHKPPDEEHPYGHGKIEPLVGLLIVGILLLIAAEIALGSYNKIISGAISPSPAAAFVAFIGIFANIYLASYLKRAGNELNSPSILSVAANKKTDIISNVAVFFGVCGAILGFPILDPVLGIVVSLFILKTAIEVGINNLHILMGTVPKGLKKEILDLNLPGCHDIKINNMGSYAAIELHIEVPSTTSVRRAHEIAEKVEEKLLTIENVEIAEVHVCVKD